MDSQNRALVYCHSCEEEWFRDEHGLTCPHCHSEFTEIIEANHDPRIDQSIPTLGDLPQPSQRHPLYDHDPWAAPDPDEDDIENLQFRPTPNGFTVTGTIHRSLSPTGEARDDHGQPRPALHDLLNNFTSMMAGIAGPQPGEETRSPGSNSRSGPGQRTPTPDPRSPTSDERNPLENMNVRGGQVEVRSGPGQGSRFTFTSSTQLFPRDGNGSPPGSPPVDTIQNILNDMLFGAQGRAWGPPNQAHPPSGSRGPPPPPFPLATLLQTMLGVPPGGVQGDGVYTQEAFDRIISQLMEQNATGSAPGPASAEAIAAIPRVKIDKSMLGDSGKAECSICMDEVILDQEVAKLPCTHWFHIPCIEAWLGEHDTCPHCRQGIASDSEPKNSADASLPRRSASATAVPAGPSSSVRGGRPSDSTMPQMSGLPGGFQFPPPDPRYYSQPATPSRSSGGRRLSSSRRGSGGSSQHGEGPQSIVDRVRNYFRGPREGSQGE
ncbi:hypothetical protein P152DRAFT_476372 [Eremomyces bilateralis CBS 781.70]|uniref:RING-type E3 ubiquitin transferase n=1 Tax=Eremomyces bilateralis CBS 781.70 TaxID=1392243 RepID=A0A6G1FUH3_9PEZI|nr:uncharacterized protein P152DRAFT_476372 [Eremomyces bilateralis CBS 781.70]KAF1809457.1 hypothetical protein P152DRAFT_476372 [Eremomyces bilateralis CBS 781.70]